MSQGFWVLQALVRIDFNITLTSLKGRSSQTHPPYQPPQYTITLKEKIRKSCTFKKEIGRQSYGDSTSTALMKPPLESKNPGPSVVLRIHKQGSNWAMLGAAPQGTPRPATEVEKKEGMGKQSQKPCCPSSEEEQSSQTSSLRLHSFLNKLCLAARLFVFI